MPPKGTHFKMSDEARARISASLRGRKHSEETKKKISEGNRGLKRSAEAVENNRRAHIGLPGNRKGATHTEGARQKLRDARAGQFHPKLALHGLDQEMVDAAAIRGMRWCGGCKAFIFGVLFYSSIQRYCIECCGLSRNRDRDKRTPERRQEIVDNLKRWRADNPDYEKRWRLLSKYGVTPEWYDERFLEQSGGCALCLKQLDPASSRKWFCVDHDHRTGVVRALLCTKCNTALERLENVPDWAYRALAYLARYAVSDETNQKES